MPPRLFPPGIFLHVICTVFPLRFNLVVFGTEEPEVLRLAGTALRVQNYMIYFEIPRLIAPSAVRANKCAQSTFPLGQHRGGWLGVNSRNTVKGKCIII